MVNVLTLDKEFFVKLQAYLNRYIKQIHGGLIQTVPYKYDLMSASISSLRKTTLAFLKSKHVCGNTLTKDTLLKFITDEYYQKKNEFYGKYLIRNPKYDAETARKIRKTNKRAYGFELRRILREKNPTGLQLKDDEDVFIGPSNLSKGLRKVEKIKDIIKQNKTKKKN